MFCLLFFFSPSVLKRERDSFIGGGREGRGRRTGQEERRGGEKRRGEREESALVWPWDIVNWSLRYWRMGRILGNNAGGGPRGGKGCEGAVIGVFFLLLKTMWKRAYCENAAHRNLVPLWSASCHLTG